MSTLADLGGPTSAAGDASTLFQHEIRRDGRMVAVLCARSTATGVTVESEVYPLNQPPGTGAVTRPFVFTTLDQARRFADEALQAFEYLNCSVS